MKKYKVTMISGVASIDAPGQDTVKKSAAEAPKGAQGRAPIKRSTSLLRPARGPMFCRGLSPTRN